MRTLKSFCTVSLDGRFVDGNGEMAFAHNPTEDPEWDALVAANASSGGTLLFGRLTYQMMASFWPTPMAKEQNAQVAKHMNRLSKVVFSRTLKKVDWENTALVTEDAVTAVRQMKKEKGPDLVILGSGNLVSQLAAAGLIDTFELALAPVVVGKGKTLFETVKEPLTLKRTKARTFANGNVLVCYQAA